MDLGFRGAVADYYHRYRRGYPPAAIDALVEAFGLSTDDVVVDLGCGTGQLTLPLARRVRSVVAVDPEPDMLVRARSAAGEQGVANVSWMIGSDADLPTLGTVIGDRNLGGVTVGQALHWMDHEKLFRDLAPLLRSGGGVAVLANGTPLWQQDTAWSHALRGYLEQWLGTKLTRTCGTDDASQLRYGDSLTAAGYDVASTAVDYTDELSTEQIVGGVYSALPVHRLPAPEQREQFAERLHDVLQPHLPFTEQIRVSILTGRVAEL
ncbi:class I SAM-dependent methyltransferase [Kibdelosporangium phytohabitans]|uniref:Methyltransferase n=1 Tax=Kibdelosporangium phytohabitans TaxID=860235 RepID=A0A0N9HZF2_9PSEU|nr:class I SAM-dependent methyltransferase [Kibdelosporangium phytohabitans]ALG09138.1 methyltransferase [Kibdelosporangium phytohabitans]MBE1469644.1 ubiquinone/menaquinone biosynthesis C-methylase UbiE [Kibdelosporangium phytohabitans]